MIYEHYIRYKYNYIILAILSQLVKVTSKYSSGWRSYGNLNNTRFANENFVTPSAVSCFLPGETTLNGTY